MIPKDGPPPPIEPTPDGFVFFNRGAVLAAFAPDVGADLGAFMADSQVPISYAAAGGAPVTKAAWKSKPSWYLVAADDHIIPPDAQRLMAERAGATVAETKGSHVAFISHPKAAAEIIERAASLKK